MTDYTRLKSAIIKNEDQTITHYDSINKAKKASVQLQSAGKTVKVIRDVRDDS